VLQDFDETLKICVQVADDQSLACRLSLYESTFDVEIPDSSVFSFE